jgi:hypothetical protein
VGLPDHVGEQGSSPIASLDTSLRFVRPPARDAKTLDNAGANQDGSRGRANPTSDASDASVFEDELPPERSYLGSSGHSLIERERVLHGAETCIHHRFVHQLLSAKAATHPRIGVLGISPPASEHGLEESADAGTVSFVITTKSPIEEQLGFVSPNVWMPKVEFELSVAVGV